MKSIDELQKLIQKGIQTFDLPDTPANLYDPIRYILSLGGKRMRPLLVLLGYGLRRQDYEKVVNPALAVEVFHNFTLMHDDIMDEAPIRRGQPTVHEKWDRTVAILSGDTMLVKAYDLLVYCDQSVLPDALRRFNQTATEVCEGQQLDMDFEKLEGVSEAQYLEMIRLKTAVLLGFSLELGGLLAGMDSENQKKLYQVGENMGIGFQLMDDYLDVYADQSKFGKQVGGDIISNKKTYLLITALINSTPSQKKVLQDWLGRTSFDPQEKVHGVKQLFDEIGVGQLTRAKMDDYFGKAFALFDSVEGDEVAKKTLIGFANALVQRDH